MEGLRPLDTPGARILVLGSFPSLMSLEKGEYYGHPRNHFWPILAAIAGIEAPGDYAARKGLAALLGIAIWDLVGACSRPGSLDADIKDAKINDIIGYIRDRPNIRRIALNGGAATAYFARAFAPESGLGKARIGDVIPWRAAGEAWSLPELCRLPSTSPIPTARFKTAADKLPFWARYIAASAIDSPGADLP